MVHECCLTNGDVEHDARYVRHYDTKCRLYVHSLEQCVGLRADDDIVALCVQYNMTSLTSQITENVLWIHIFFRFTTNIIYSIKININ